jgi:raffinose/stachyose/melibiose transport system substrate-binding protein
MKMFHKKGAIRTLAGIAVSAVIALTFAGCASSPSSKSTSSDPVKSSSSLSGDLTVSYLSGNPFTDDTLKKFGAMNPGLKIRDVQSTSNTYQAQIRAQLDSGQGPDVIFIWTGSGNAMAAQILGGAGKLVNLSNQPWAKSMDPAAKTLVSLNGKVYGLTTVQNPYGFFYNKDKMKELGITPPTTFSGLINTCKAVRKKGLVLIALGAQTGYLAYGIPAQLANSIAYTKDPNYLTKLGKGEETWTDSKVWNQSLSKALDEYQTMIKAGCFQDNVTGYSEDAVKQMVASGKAVGTYLISAGLPALRALAPDMKIDFATLPATEKASDLVLTANPGSAWGVSASSKNKAAAEALVNYMGTPQRQALDAQANFGFPYTVNKDVKVPAELTGAGKLYKEGKVLLFPTALWPNPEVKQTIIAECQNLLNGNETVDGVLKAVQKSFGGK